MKRRFIIYAALIPVFGIAWIVTASAIYCQMSSKMHLFVFPFAQWFEVMPYWRDHWTVTAYFVISGFLPTAIVFMVGYMIVQYERKAKPVLYGDAGFADIQDMRQGGIRISRKPQ